MEIKRYLTMSALGALALAGGNAEAGKTTVPVELRTAVDRPLIVSEGDAQKVVIKIEVEGEKVALAHRAPLNLSIVLDRSGSMSGAKLEQAKQAAAMLIDQLGEDDVVSVVLYDTEVDVLVPARRLEGRRNQIQRMISRVQTGGSTALYAGVEEGGDQLREFFTKEKINRVILLSDGIANVGPSSNREIAALGTQLAHDGMSVTTIGLGNDYNETLMTALAEASDANYYYVEDVEKLPDVFTKELGELQSIVARDIEIEIRCPKGVRPLRFLGRPGELKKRTESVAFGTLSSQQVRELYLECLIEPESFDSVSEIAECSVRFKHAASGDSASAKVSPVVVGYTKDTTLAEKSVNRAIVAEAAIFANAVETERAIALADEGNIEACRDQLRGQWSALKEAYAAAPAAQQAQLAEEIRSVEEAERDLEDNQLSKAQRKKLSNDTFMLRNSKR